MKRLVQSGLLVMSLTSAWPCSSIAQNIANPLIRPSHATENKESAPAGAASKGAAPAAGGETDSEDVKRQAERRITQEDLNIRQQELNSPVVPSALVNFFSNMQVTAYIQNAIVMRKISNEQIQTVAVTAAPQSGGTNIAGVQEQQAPSLQNVSRSTAVIRLRVGQVVNVAGYSVRAKVTGQEVTVEWLSSKGTWVNVFYGALESSNGGFTQVPNEAQLLKVETEAFNHLVPKLNTQSSTTNTVGGNQPGNFGSPPGGAQSPGQPGFGSSSPTFR